MEQQSALLKELKNHKSICWYPSAGSDFRPLLYLSKSFYEKHEELSAENAALPNLFIMTDYQALSYQDFSNYTVCRSQGIDKMQNGSLKRGDVLYEDIGTRLTVKAISQFSVSDIEPKEDLIKEDVSSCYGQGYYMTVKIDSHGKLEKRLGTWEADVIYLYAENTAFAKNILLQNQIHIDYTIRVRYGNRMGGGSKGTSGIWLFYLADLLNIKYFVSNSVFNEYIRDGDEEALEYLKGDSGISFEKPKLTPLYTRKWYKNEPVVWYRVEKGE